jgi:hypothetical protein
MAKLSFLDEAVFLKNAGMVSGLILAPLPEAAILIGSSVLISVAQ